MTKFLGKYDVKTAQLILLFELPNINNRIYIRKTINWFCEFSISWFNYVTSIPACGVSNRQMRVVGGEVTKINEFPWIGGLSKGGEFLCGVTLITKKHVITAAHCVSG